MATEIGVGQKAPDFSLLTQDGTSVRLSELTAKGPVVLFFYPKDNTSGCTAEVCSFRDQHEDFLKTGATVVGVSSDSAGSHQEFATQHRLPYVLLSDVGGKVRELFGVPRAFLGLAPGRVTYIIDQAGVVQHVFNSMFAATKHAEEALVVVRRLRDKASVRP